MSKYGPYMIKLAFQEELSTYSKFLLAIWRESYDKKHPFLEIISQISWKCQKQEKLNFEEIRKKDILNLIYVFPYIEY